MGACRRHEHRRTPTGPSSTPGPDAGTPPPRIIAIFSKLTGNVERQKILDLAPGELNNLAGFTRRTTVQKSTLSGYPAYCSAEPSRPTADPSLIAQKTVVIPVGADVYRVAAQRLRHEDQDNIMGAATDAIDAKTKITI